MPTPVRGAAEHVDDFVAKDLMVASDRSAAFLRFVFVSALLVRVAVGLGTESWLVSPAAQHWDFGYEMGRIAGSLAAGDGFAYPTDPPRLTAWMPPAYPAFLASVFMALGAYTPGSAMVILGFQIVASAFSCVLLFLLARRLYGTIVARIAALVLVFYPASIHYAAQKIWSTTFFSTAMIAALLLALDRETLTRPRKAISLGLIFGLCVLLNPVFIAVLMPLLGWMAWTQRATIVGDPKAIATLLATVVLTISPWVVRNQFVFDAFVPIKSNFGHELLVGNHAAADGCLPQAMSGIEREFRQLEQPVHGLELSTTDLDHLRSSGEVAANRFYLTMAVEAIRDRPARFVALTGRRAFRYWTIVKTPTGLIETVSHGFYLSVLVLALIGVVEAVQSRKLDPVLIIPLVFFPAVYYVTIVGLYRYRFPIEPVLIVLAAFAVATVWQRVPSPISRRVLGSDPVEENLDSAVRSSRA